MDALSQNVLLCSSGLSCNYYDKECILNFPPSTKGSNAILCRDAIRGDVKFNTDAVGDFVIMRSNGLPVYNFCVAVDDALMRISHVIRAEEHLPNTLRQENFLNYKFKKDQKIRSS